MRSKLTTALPFLLSSLACVSALSAQVAKIGTGCASNGATRIGHVPTLALDPIPRLGVRTMLSIRMSHTAGAGFIAISPKQTNQPFGKPGVPGADRCRLYVDLGSALLSPISTVFGRSDTTIPVPNDPLLVGVRFFAQAYIRVLPNGNPNDPALLNGTLTNGLDITIQK